MASSSTQTKPDSKAAETKPEQQTTQQKPAAALEEDDEFEDFPVDGSFPSPFIHPASSHFLPSYLLSALPKARGQNS